MNKIILPLLVISISALADSGASRLVVGRSFACIFSPEDTPSVRCWDHDGREQTTPKIKNIENLVSAGGIVCAIAKEQVHCWNAGVSGNQDYIRGSIQRTKKVFQSFRAPGLISGGDFDSFCGWTPGLGLISSEYYTTRWATSLEVARKALSSPNAPPVALSMASNTACALSADSKVHCWYDSEPNVDSREKESFKIFRNSVPSDLRSPTGFAITDTRGCVVEGDRIRCWGDLGPGKTQLSSPPLVAPVSLAMTVDHGTFVLASGELRRMDKNGQWEALPDPVDRLENIGLLASNVNSVCVANDEELACRLAERCRCPDDNKSSTFRILHGMKLWPAALAFVEPLLERISKNVYAEKRRLMTAAAALVRDASPERRVFVMTALEPIVTHTDSEYVMSQIGPYYHRLRGHFLKYFQKEKLNDFPRSRENVALALKLIGEGIPALASTNPAWAEVKHRLGVAMADANPESLKQLTLATRAVATELATLSTEPRNRGPAFFVIGLIDFLRVPVE